MGKQLVVGRAGRKDFQSVNGGVSGGLQLDESGAREISVEEKFHSLARQTSTPSMAVRLPANSRHARMSAP